MAFRRGVTPPSPLRAHVWLDPLKLIAAVGKNISTVLGHYLVALSV